ncbi:MAG TPA: ABC transporter permease [Geminicoccus sp.]|jgi:simple sugar transport system permease protein|uniref:ABC transporter permease n=1 Tax=Geminicoccus sp. TaxID=2024832 RepID=UPI002E35B77D|nr:ABC transporter permease [Geminicoccus sp.]HEX2525506.1 ABC transporter permease [Geminicoccus sp.]
MAASGVRRLPAWADYGLLPLLNLAVAFLIAGLVVVALGESPLEASGYLVRGAFGNAEMLSWTLFYATNFVFTGLAVAIAFHAGLFNIGAEGQAYIGGLGLTLVCLYLGDLPFFLVLPLAMIGSALFGAAWGFVPGWLQARRGSHIVITTIMFNFIAASIMTYLLVYVLIRPGSSSPESAMFPENTWLPELWQIAERFGLSLPETPLNLSFLWALICAFLFWLFLTRTRAGFELRVVGRNDQAAVYAGISPAKWQMMAMALSGALASFITLNEIMGSQHRLLLNFTGGYGFVGIAVALMGRNHPIGIILAAILFGALYQGGSELAFDMPAITKDMVVVVQGLVILFAGALEHFFRPTLERLFRRSMMVAA